MSNQSNSDQRTKVKPRFNRPEKVEKWKERVVQIQRVSKVLKGGKKLSFRAIVIIGNRNSKVGVGVGKADEVSSAIKKAITDARKNVIQIPLTKGKTIPHITTATNAAAKVLIRPAAAGTGVIAGSSIRMVLESAGVRNILAKQLGCNNLLNNARATIQALQSLKTPRGVAKEREIPLEQIFVTKN
jgi:small subunit ribosomal protein S5